MNENIVLRPWQKQVCDMISGDPDPERIIWIYDRQSAGKTTLIQYIRTHMAQDPGIGRPCDTWRKRFNIIELYQLYPSLWMNLGQFGMQIVEPQQYPNTVTEYKDLLFIKQFPYPGPKSRQVIILADFLPDIQHIDPSKVHVFMCDATNLCEMCYDTEFRVIRG